MTAFSWKATELALAKLFRAHGITGWRRRQQHFGKPDFTFHRERVVVFVDGCFWHGCPKHSRMPSSNRVFWSGKFSRNKARDRLVTRTLKKKGWRVLRIWEHDVTKRPVDCIRRIQGCLRAAAASPGRKGP